MNLQELQQKIDQLSKSLDGFGSTNFNSRDVWNLRKEVYDGFRTTNFPSQEEKQEVWNKIQTVFDLLKQCQEDVNKANEAFAIEVEKKIEAIRESSNLSDQIWDKDKFSSIKDALNEVLTLTKESRFPSKERKEEVWAKFSQLRDKVREQENAFYAKIQEQKNKHSHEITTELMRIIEACHPDSALNHFVSPIEKLKPYLAENDMEYTGFDWLLALPEEKAKSPLKVKSDGLRELRRFLTEHRESITKEDRQDLYSYLEEIQEALDKAWTLYKDTLQKRQEEWEERKKNQELQSSEWRKKQEEFLQRLEINKKKQLEFKEKLLSSVNGQQDFLRRLKSRLESQESFIAKLKEQIDELDGKYAIAKSESFKERVIEWKNEKKAKIEDVEVDIKNIQHKMQDVENSIEVVPAKIKDVERSIHEIDSKIEEVKSKL